MNTPRLISSSPHRLRLLLLATSLLLALGFVAGPWTVAAQARDDASKPTAVWDGRWSDAVLDLAARIPVQAGGRIKPLDTWAGFALLNANGRRSCKDDKGNKVSSLAWCLDAMFRPELAKRHHSFLVDTDEVLVAVGLPDLAKKKRDRYSYSDLVPDMKTRKKISSVARRLHGMESSDRSRVESAIVSLDSALSVFESLVQFAAFGRLDFDLSKSAALQAAFDGKEHVGFGDLLEKAPALAAKVRAEMVPAGHGEKQPALSEETQAISDVLNAAFQAAQGGPAFGLLPPATSVAKEAQWYTLRDVAGFAMLRGVLPPEHLRAVRDLEKMAESAGRGGDAFQESLKSYQGRVQRLAEERGEFGKIEREVSYYKLDPFGKSLVFYLIAFALLAITWLAPKLRWLELLAWGTLWATLGLHTYGIVQRCIIRDRPPVTGLYDTVIFITAVGVLSMLIIEHINHLRIALSLTPILGALGLFVAARYEVLNGGDTMPQLVAVLDTNFWLATHVTCISIGYCAALIAGLIAHVYVLGRVFQFKRDDAAWYRSIGKMVYGTLCFALLFALVGTILGGIWANESWGRFWGWDPKENGALLICIALLAVLHGRVGGIFSTFGTCQGAIISGCVVAFSWWGVNLLNIGLHSYGFTSGIMRGLLMFYGIEGAVLLAGVYAWMRDRPRAVKA